MHYKKEINYHDYKNLLYSFSTEMLIYYVPLQYNRKNSLHNRGKMCQPCHPAGSVMVNPV